MLLEYHDDFAPMPKPNSACASTSDGSTRFGTFRLEDEGFDATVLCRFSGVSCSTEGLSEICLSGW
jgi:hypothetical protein